MRRLGELLLESGAITAEQLAAGLRSQGQFRGRIGTRLADLGFVDLDTVSGTLGAQHRFAALQRKYIAAVDPKVIARIPPSLAYMHKVIAIGYTRVTPKRLIVASMEPWTLPLEELSFAAGGRVEAWIAPQGMIEEALERYYGVAPSSRRYVDMSFAELHGSQDAPGSAESLDDLGLIPLSDMMQPQTPAVIGRVAIQQAAVPQQQTPAAPPAARRPAPLLEAPVLEAPPAPARAPVVLEVPQAPRPSREFALEPPPPPIEAVPVFAARQPAVSRPAPAPAAQLASFAPTDTPDEGWDTEDVPEPSWPSLGAAKSVAPQEQGPVTAPPDVLLRPIIDRSEAIALLKLTMSKDDVAQVLVDWLRSTFGCGLILIVKDGSALGWRGFFPTAEEDLIEAIAVSLSTPNMLTTAYENRTPVSGPPPSEGSVLQNRFWKLLRCAPPAHVLVCPVPLGKRIVNLMYAHPDGIDSIPEAAAEDAMHVAREAGAAYARIVRSKP